MEVRCRSCGAVLARGLGLVPATTIDRSAAGDTTVPGGAVAIDPEALTSEAWTRDAGSFVLEHAPAGSIVIQSAARAPGAVLDVGPCNGCCGIDGSDGPNQECAVCHAMVGTVWTDCWTPDEVRFLPDAVELARDD